MAVHAIHVGKNLHEDDPKKGFESHTEFLLKIKDAAERPMRVDPRLEPLRVKATVGSDEQSGNDGQFGAFLTPIGFSPDVLGVAVDDPTAPLVTPVPMDATVVTLPARTDKDHTSSVSGGLVVTRKRQTVLPTSSRMSLEGVQLAVNTQFGLSYGSGELVRSTPRAFITILLTGFLYQFAVAIFLERLNGKGGGEPLGVMNAGCLITVSKETGQAAGTIIRENIDNMVSRAWSYNTRGVWICHEDGLPQLQKLALAVGTGGAPVPYLTWDDAGQARLLGRPIFFSEYPATLGTTGDLILGAWSEYLYGTYQPLQSAESIHTRFEPTESVFKFWMRTDGAPWWKTPLTPRNSTTTRSPFVALATRA